MPKPASITVTLAAAALVAAPARQAAAQVPPDFSGMGEADAMLRTMTVMGGILLAIPTVSGTVCLATDDECPSVGSLGLVFGIVSVLGGAVVAAMSGGYGRDTAVGFVVAGAGVIALSGFVLVNEADQPSLAVEPTTLPGKASCVPGLAVVTTW